jgi:hypothetical protein
MTRYVRQLDKRSVAQHWTGADGRKLGGAAGARQRTEFA